MGRSNHHRNNPSANPNPNSSVRLGLGKVLPIWMSVLRLTRVKGLNPNPNPNPKANPTSRSRSFNSRASLLHGRPAMSCHRAGYSDGEGGKAYLMNPFKAMRCGSLKTESSRFLYDSAEEADCRAGSESGYSVTLESGLETKACHALHRLAKGSFAAKADGLPGNGERVNGRKSGFPATPGHVEWSPESVGTTSDPSSSDASHDYSTLTFDSTTKPASQQSMLLDALYHSDGNSAKAKEMLANHVYPVNKAVTNHGSTYSSASNSSMTFRRDTNSNNVRRETDGEMMMAVGALEKDSVDPFMDFVTSICEVILCCELRESEDLEALFLNFLRLNHPSHHRTIALSFLHVLHHFSTHHHHYPCQVSRLLPTIKPA